MKRMNAKMGFKISKELSRNFKILYYPEYIHELLVANDNESLAFNKIRLIKHFLDQIFN